MKREIFTLFILIVAISFLHATKKDEPLATPQAAPKATPAMVQQQPAATNPQWNNNFTLIRFKY